MLTSLSKSGMINKYVKNVWPVGQVVKTPPFHGGIMGSNPVRVTFQSHSQFAGGFFRIKKLQHRLTAVPELYFDLPIFPGQ